VQLSAEKQDVGEEEDFFAQAPHAFELEDAAHFPMMTASAAQPAPADDGTEPPVGPIG
jgi:hypothetical protein